MEKNPQVSNIEKIEELKILKNTNNHIILNLTNVWCLKEQRRAELQVNFKKIKIFFL